MRDPTNPKEEMMLKLALCGLSPQRLLRNLEPGRPAPQDLPSAEASTVHGGTTSPPPASPEPRAAR